MKDLFKIKREKRKKRARRTRAKILSSAKRPRLSIFRSNKHVYIQLIDSEKRVTLASASDLELENKKISKTEKANLVGRLIAKKTLDLKIAEVIFDKGSYKYHGIIKSAAEGARAAGLKF